MNNPKEDDPLTEYFAKQGIKPPKALAKLPSPEHYATIDDALEASWRAASSVISDMEAIRASGKTLTREQCATLKDATGIITDVHKAQLAAQAKPAITNSYSTKELIEAILSQASPQELSALRETLTEPQGALAEPSQPQNEPSDTENTLTHGANSVAPQTLPKPV